MVLVLQWISQSIIGWMARKASVCVSARAREQKRRMLVHFVEENHIGPAQVMRAYEKFKNLPSGECDGNSSRRQQRDGYL